MNTRTTTLPRALLLLCLILPISGLCLGEEPTPPAIASARVPVWIVDTDDLEGYAVPDTVFSTAFSPNVHFVGSAPLSRASSLAERAGSSEYWGVVLDLGSEPRVLYDQLAEVARCKVPGVIVVPFRDEGVPNIVERLLAVSQKIRSDCDSIRFLSLSFEDGPIPKEVLSAISEVHSLESLLLCHYNQDSDPEFACLAALPKLKRVVLQGDCRSLTPFFDFPSIEEVTVAKQSCPYLHSLVGISHAKHLRTLLVEGGVTEFQELAEATSLQTVYLFSRVESYLLCSALSKLPDLLTASVGVNSIDELDLLAKCPKLRKLSLLFMSFVNNISGPLSRLKIEEIQFFGDNGYEVESFLGLIRVLDAIPNLKKASIGYFPSDRIPEPDELELISRVLGRLDSLAIGSCLVNPTTLWFGEFLASLKNLKALTLLRNGRSVPESFVCAIAKSKSLTHLALSADACGSKAYQSIAAMPSLSHLYLIHAGGCRYGDISKLISSGSLKELCVFGACYLREEDVAKLGATENCPRLVLECSMDGRGSWESDNMVLWPMTTGRHWRTYLYRVDREDIVRSLEIAKERGGFPSMPTRPEGLPDLVLGLEPHWFTNKTADASKFSDEFALILVPLEYAPGIFCILHFEGDYSGMYAVVPDEKTLKALQGIDATSFDWTLDGPSRLKVVGLRWLTKTDAWHLPTGH